MPRDIGTGLYHYPDGTPGNPGQTVFSARYNTFINDLANALNQALPLNMGGTGASDAIEARDNLDAERAMQQVTNFDSHIWEAGSFFALPGATSAPFAGHTFFGTVYGSTAATGSIAIEAIDLNSGGAAGPDAYVRVYNGTSWGSWVSKGSVFDSKYINTTGDTMTGSLTISPATGATPIFAVNAATSTDSALLLGGVAGVARWGLYIGDSTPETGGNVGTNFQLARWSDTGVQLPAAITIQRNNSDTVFAGNVYLNSGNLLRLNAPTYSRVQINTNDGTTYNSGLDLMTGGTARFTVVSHTTDFVVQACNDAGVPTTTSLLINRATSNATLGAGLKVTGGASFFNATLGSSPGVGNTTTGVCVGITGSPALVASNGGGGVLFLNSNSDTWVVSFNRSGSGVGSIYCSSTTTAYNTTSDARLKEDLQPFNAGGIIDATNVYNFKWKSTGERAFGIIAQEANKVYPAAVMLNEEQDRWYIDYSKYVPILLQEAKSLRVKYSDALSRIEKLAARIEALEAAQAPP